MSVITNLYNYQLSTNGLFNTHNNAVTQGLASCEIHSPQRHKWKSLLVRTEELTNKCEVKNNGMLSKDKDSVKNKCFKHSLVP